MWQYIIPAAAAVIVAIVEAIAARERRQQKEDKKRVDARAQRRAEESRLSMRMMDASLELGVATALAVENHRMNGEMAAAKKAAAEAQADYKLFVERVAAEQLAKK